MAKAILFLIFFCSIVTTANAQWHIKTCEVPNIYDCTTEEFECLWKNASKNVTGGAITTSIGSASIVSGIVVYSRVYSPEGDLGHALIGGFLIITGVVADVVGITAIKRGKNRKDLLRTTPNYKSLMPESLNITPDLKKIPFNNTYSIGISATLNF